MSGRLSLRERRKHDTRRLIARAALELAVERGPDVVTVTAITTAAGLSPRTFFNYFSSKEQAILACDPPASEVIRRELDRRPLGEAPLDALRVALLALAAEYEASLDEHRARLELVSRSVSLRNAYLGEYAAIESTVVEALAARTGADPESGTYTRVMVAAGLSAMRVASERWCRQERAIPLVAALSDAFDHLTTAFQHPRRR